MLTTEDASARLQQSCRITLTLSFILNRSIRSIPVQFLIYFHPTVQFSSIVYSRLQKSRFRAGVRVTFFRNGCLPERSENHEASGTRTHSLFRSWKWEKGGKTLAQRLEVVRKQPRIRRQKRYAECTCNKKFPRMSSLRHTVCGIVARSNYLPLVGNQVALGESGEGLWKALLPNKHVASKSSTDQGFHLTGFHQNLMSCCRKTTFNSLIISRRLYIQIIEIRSKMLPISLGKKLLKAQFGQRGQKW